MVMGLGGFGVEGCDRFGALLGWRSGVVGGVAEGVAPPAGDALLLPRRGTGGRFFSLWCTSRSPELCVILFAIAPRGGTRRVSTTLVLNTSRPGNPVSRGLGVEAPVELGGEGVPPPRGGRGGGVKTLFSRIPLRAGCGEDETWTVPFSKVAELISGLAFFSCLKKYFCC